MDEPIEVKYEEEFEFPAKEFGEDPSDVAFTVVD